MKKIFALLIVAFLTVTLTLPVGASISLDDCKNLMSSLSVIEENEYRENEIITRGEFAKIMTRFWNMSSSDSKSDLETLFQLGAAGKDKNGNLRENEPLTYDEAIFSILSLVDYSVAAESAGGYPSGYRTIASKNGLVCSKNSTQSMTWDDVIVLLYKMMYLPKMEVSYGNVLRFTQLKDETVMYEVFGLRETTGVLNAYGDVALNNGNTLDANRVQIGTQSYFTNIDCETMIGKTVTVFYKDNGSEKEAVLIFEENRNSVLRIEADNEPKYNGYNYTYRENNKQKKATLENRFSVLYNGHVAQSSKDMTFEPKDGYIELIDNDGDKKYDVVKIFCSDIYEVNTIETVEDGTLIYADGKPPVKILTDESKLNTTKLYAGDGAKTRLSKLKVGEIVTVYSYMNNGTLTAESVYFTNEIFEGVVTSYSKDDRTIDIDEVSYKYHSSVEDDFQSVILGNYRHFATDYEGRIIFLFDESLTEKNKGVGYLLRSGTTSGLRRNLQLKIFDSNGNMRILTVGKKVYVDGVVKNTYEDIESAISGKTGLISYILNNDETIRSVDFAENITYEDSNVIEPMNHLTLVEGDLDAGGKKLYWRKSIRSIGENSFCSPDTKLIILPADDNAVDTTWPVDDNADEQEYVVLDPADYFADGGSYSVKTYSFNGGHLIDFIVYVQGKTNTSFGSKGIHVIKDIRYALQEDGTTTVRMQLMSEYGTEDYYCVDASVFTQCSDGTATVTPEVGDVIRFTPNHEGKILNIRMVYDCSTGAFTPSYGGTDSTFGVYTSTYVVEKGNVYDKQNDILLMTRKDISQSLNNLQSSDFEGTLISKSTIIVVDENGEVKGGKAGDIKSYKTHSGEFSKVVIGGQGNLRSTIVVYEN